MSGDSAFNRKNPFPATLTVNRKLTAGGSNKETRHLEVSIAGSGLRYEAGDSLGVFPQNDPLLIEAILARLGFDGSEPVPGPDGGARTLREALLADCIVTHPSKQFLEALADRDPSAAPLKDLLVPSATKALSDFLWGRDMLDMLDAHPAASFTPTEFVGCLRKLQPRLYSIASSQRSAGDNVHLTVGVVRYTPEGSTRPRTGVCSAFLAERAAGQGAVPVFIHSAKHFRMPEDPEAPCIMVGPGTGIAPFRAFLQEREQTGASGRNWLFFGEQHAATDFFYRDEFERWHEAGLLTKLVTAFSRDQNHKIYVQHRMLEHAAELYAWLENGACFYVCGDAQRMAKDVDHALHQIAGEVGGKSDDEARAFVEELKKQKRYRKDVY